MENQGLQVRCPKENVFLIDWFTVTLHDTYVDEVQRILGLNHVIWTTKTSFINGYPMDTSFSNIHIRWGADNPLFYSDGYDKSGTFRTADQKARVDMGISLDMSGQGCRSFEEFSSVSWFDFFTELYRLGRISVTRMDLAYDDHEGLLNIWRMKLDVEDRNYLSKAKKSRIIWSDDQEKDIRGLTIQIGSQTSDVLIRIYDKAAERGFTDRHWVRVELQLRKERASEALRLLFRREDVGRVVSGILRNYLLFVTPVSTDTNKSRWPVAEYWQRVLEGMEKLRVWIAPGEPYNFSKSEEHMIFQYGQWLVAYAQIHNGRIDGLLDQAQRRNLELKPKYQAAVQQELLRSKQIKERKDQLAEDLGFNLDSAEWWQDYQSNFVDLLVDHVDDPDFPF